MRKENGKLDREVKRRRMVGSFKLQFSDLMIWNDQWNALIDVRYIAKYHIDMMNLKFVTIINIFCCDVNNIYVISEKIFEYLRLL